MPTAVTLATSMSADLVEAHASYPLIVDANLLPGGSHAPLGPASNMLFEPSVDPFRSKTNRLAPADLGVPQLAFFAGCVDGVSADSGVFGGLAHSEPSLLSHY